ncbi:MAG TPA: flagellar filament capping protein FliD [Acidobacteriota bacterium]|nr:flagellar filament capping protein FliD [Acidobacteriota bacterium]
MSTSPYSINLMSSSLDVSTIVQNLMYAESAPVRDMQSKVSTLQSKVTAYQSLNTNLSALSDKLNAILYGSSDAPLVQPYSFSDRLSKSIFANCSVASSDSNTISATASGAAAGGSYSFTVSNLAQAQTMISSSFADANSTSLGTGTITITKGSGDPVTITINSANSTLSGLCDAINNAQAGVTASIINDGSSTPYRLMITSNATGTANAFTVTSSLSGGQAPTFEQSSAAADAKFAVNGISVTRSSNTVSDVINGVTFTLKNTSTAPVTLQAQTDTDSIVSALNDFVTAYNAVNTFVNAQFSYNADSKTSGVLSGDSTLRQIQSMLQSSLLQSVHNQYTSLASAGQVGLEFNRDGSLTLNETEFRQAMGNNYTAVAALFLGNGTPAGGATSSDSRVGYAGETSATQAGTYAIQVDTLASRASATGDQSITSLSDNETLTITDGTGTAVVSLLQNDSLSTVLSKINSALAAQGMAATAKDDGTGKINIVTNNYGSSQTLTIVSDRDDVSGSTGFSTTPATSTGTDIAGSINGHAATGVGLTLTGASGQPEEGLSVNISQTTTGSYGSVTVASATTGVAGSGIFAGLFTVLNGLTDSLSGPIVNATDGLKQNIDSLNNQISAYQDRLSKEQDLLTQEYDQADQALRLMTVTQSSLDAQIKSLESKS